ncbi:MAG: orotidine-5'-phosphate decarboxylase [Candidatus Omnitrophica bacterium]|nr:orotidine-5'-phosphate decarboxylase [Candidatus Omnitrophota bacterium]
MNVKERLIVALDVDTEKKALDLVDKLKGHVKIFKVGSELFSSCGPDIVRLIRKKGCDIFLDLKLNDIPNTVAKASISIARLGVSIFDLHALGGYDMMKKAKDASEEEAKSLKVTRPKVLAVTVLTSFDENGLKKTGIYDNIEAQVLRLARLAKDAGLDGVIASPFEVKLIRENLGKSFLIVTPGIRLGRTAPSDDQRRIATPGDAIRSGADYIVVGRPIIEARNPLDVVQGIFEEIEG